jgi:hypothetical protein
MDDWPFMSSIWPTLFVCCSYLYLVKIRGPQFMAKRKALDIKWLMMTHNAVQIIGSAYVCIWFIDIVVRTGGYDFSES